MRLKLLRLFGLYQLGLETGKGGDGQDENLAKYGKFSHGPSMGIMLNLLPFKMLVSRILFKLDVT